ncbi:Cfa-acyl carrier protein [Pectobacterium atrosepticum SCRI1043]|uniref:Cfa-acyl carrier protein n=2 Tax=Pectobacterium atrosepticum TaxID=29471 RepID=Q6D9K6_PECAS|nr:phosphopantetheine-binding protein [Pectobacterium atrosepticum]NEJ54583.1 acyl carrier protein [Rhizobium leguminosarum]GKV85736.1 coronafacic acid synthetase [Pectobacterium carotovorum subsp. carotovorum]AFH56899.1 Cfa1 [Pectobacterium atrosepticum]AIA69939.1 coronafacic acid synthetase [Pectobacterium atrosepticum]AIK12856.1 Cfa-acyl carrier protein [Pectobacterium atrosepticum]
MKNIENTIIGILIDDLFIGIPRSEIETDINMRDGLGLDSLGFSELRAQCEYAFNIKIEDEYFTPQYFDSIQTLTKLTSELILESNKQGENQ